MSRFGLIGELGSKSSMLGDRELRGGSGQFRFGFVFADSCEELLMVFGGYGGAIVQDSLL